MFHGYFEYIDASSSRSLKFWEIATEGVRVTIRQGKVGTVGKIETQEFTGEACAKQVEKKTQAITSKGYIKIDLENLQQLNQLSTVSIISILAGSQAPVVFLDWAASHDSVEVLSSVATHPQTTKSTLEKLLHSHESVASLVKLHVNYAGEMSSGYTEAAIDAMQMAFLYPSRKQVLELASVGVIPEYLLDTLEPDLRVAIAKNENVASNILTYLVADWYEPVRQALAANNSTPAELLEQLAKDKAADVRVVVAKNPNIPAKSLMLLASDAYEKVLLAVLSNKNASGEVLLKLYEEHKYYNQRRLGEIASNPTTSVEVLDKLSQHSPCSVAENPNASLSTLRRLAKSDDLYVRRSVAENPNASAEILIEVLCYQHKPEDLVNRQVKPPMVILAEGKQRFIEEPIYCGDENALANASRHLNLPLSIIEQLIQNLGHILQWEWGETIIEGIASNPNIHNIAFDWLVKQDYKNINHPDIAVRNDS